MSNQKGHTPGPWIVAVPSAGATTARIRVQEGLRHVTLADVNLCGQDARGLANARLMALAPELLDALYQALPYVEDAVFDVAFKQGVVWDQAKAIRALLARADQEAK